MQPYEIIDLSSYFDRLKRYDDIAEELSEEEQAKIVSYIKQCHTMSYRSISKRYPHWEEADKAHDVYVDPDATEFREKAVIPDTRAIADTVITYMMAALGGRNPMFQLEGMNRQSRKPALLLERVLHQQMRRTAGEARIAQHLLDIVRYGMAPMKIVWNTPDNQNNLINFSPRKTFPDPRVTWGDWEKMSFLIFSDHISFETLHRSQLYPKLNKNPLKYAENIAVRQGWEGHRDIRLEGRGFNIKQHNVDSTSTSSFFRLGSNRVIDEAWLSLAGYQIGIPSINTVFLQVVILDEKEIIAFRLNPYGMNFPSVIGGLYQDTHKTYSQGLYDLLLPLHDIATWLMRSRVDNVQAALNNLIFVDPTMVSVPDLIDRNPWGIVRTLPGVKPGDGIHVTTIPDVTKSHWQDIAALGEMKQRVSAASDAQQGIPTSDVRSATEIQRLTQLGSQRLGVLSRVISATSIRPAVRMMVSNLKDALSMDGSIPAQSVPGALTNMVQDGFIDFGIEDLQGDIDYLVIDGTLPLEPQRNAQTWIDMLGMLNQTGLIMEYKAGRIAEEAIRAMGISDVESFKISPEEAAQGPTPSQKMALAEVQRGNSVVQPNEQVQRSVEKGNLVPISQAKKARGR